LKTHQSDGYEQSEQLDVQPAKYFVRVTKREKRACKACEEQGVRCAPLPPRIIEKGLASDRVVIDTVVSKYSDHLAHFIAKVSCWSERPVWRSPERHWMVG
jgi:transposase